MKYAKKKERGEKEGILNRTNSKGEAQRVLFLKYFLNEELDGKKNPYFGKAGRSAIAAGYSKTYGAGILAALAGQQNAEAQSYINLKKDLRDALQANGINGAKLATQVSKLLDSNDLRNVDKQLVDTGNPDSFASRVALDFVGKTQKLYEGEDERDSRSKDEIIEAILRRLT